jgi:2-oxoglutarate ferredoxin oxidoreductase subunit gamma
MSEKIIIAGAGGQGVMLLGKIMAEAAVYTGFETTWLPAYGAEVRGGAAYCMVIIDEEPIGNPYIEQADAGIALNEAGFQRFRQRVRTGGLWILNASLAAAGSRHARNTLALPFTDEAVRLGNVRVANIIALGAYIARRSLLSPAAVENVIKKHGVSVPGPLVEMNLAAFATGMRLAQSP